MQFLKAVFAESLLSPDQLPACPAAGALSASFELADPEGKILCLLIMDRLVEGWVFGYWGTSLPPQMQTFAGSARQLECSRAD